MEFNLNGKAIQLSQFTWRQFRALHKSTGISLGDRITMEQVHEIVKYGCKCHGIEVDDEDLDSAPFSMVQSMFLELMRQEVVLGPNPTGR